MKKLLQRFYKGANINAVFILVCILLLADFLNANMRYFNRMLSQNESANQGQDEIVKLSDEFTEVSSNLAYYMYNYMAVGDIEYFKSYWNMAKGQNSREAVLKNILKYDLSKNEKDIINGIREDCTKIQEYEIFFLRNALKKFHVKSKTYEGIQPLKAYIIETENYDLRDLELLYTQDGNVDFNALGEKYHYTADETTKELREFCMLVEGRVDELARQDEKIREQIFISRIVCVVLVIACIILLTFQNNKVYSLRHINEMFVEAINQEYIMIGTVNLQDYSVFVLKGNLEEWGLDGSLNLMELTKQYVDKFVHPAYREVFLSAVHPTHILGKMNERSGSASCIYKNNQDKWLIVDITKSKKFSLKNPVVVVTFKSAGEIINHQNEQIQREEMLMYFSREYFEVYVVDLSKGSYEVIRSAEQYGVYIKNLTGDFAQLMERAMISWTKPPYKDMFYQLLDTEDIKRRFASGEKKIEFIFEAYDEKWKRLECFPAPEYRTGNEKMIFALRDYNEEMQIKTNEVLASEAMNNIYSLVAIRDIEADQCEYIYRMENDLNLPEKGGYSDLIQLILGNIHEKDKEKFFIELSDERFERDGRAECEYRLRDKEGEYHYYRQYNAKVNMLSGSRMVILIRNIDEFQKHEIWKAEQLRKELEMTKLLAEKSKDLEKALQQAESANNAKSNFLSNMSHDLRTPMNAILGTAYLAKKHMSDEAEVDRCLDTILLSSQNMLALINDVLDMHKIESGVIEVHEKPEDLVKVIKNVEVLIRNQCEEKQQMLIIDYSGIIHRHVNMDELRVRQIITNLLSNAVKYTQTFGRISMEVKERYGKDDMQCDMIFVIRDNGIGMSKDFIEHVFEAFEREKTALSDQIEGTGLGMAIVKNLVNFMKGQIEIDSMVNVGTKVTITLPFTICDEKQTSEESNFMEFQDKYPGKRILIVEDKHINMEIVKGFLEDTELIIDEAGNGKEAVDKIMVSEEGTYDLVFMDISMPVMRGDEATVQIRQMDREDCRTMPIIAMTANALDSDVQNSYKCGMSGHISKPIEPEEVYKCLNKWLADK